MKWAIAIVVAIIRIAAGPQIVERVSRVVTTRSVGLVGGRRTQSRIHETAIEPCAQSVSEDNRLASAGQNSAGPSAKIDLAPDALLKEG